MKKLFTSCFGLGWMPIAPGTWGSMLPVLLYMIVAYLYPNPGFAICVLALSGLFFSFACVKFAPIVIAQKGDEDPGEVVADEYAGQSITLIAAVLLNPGFEYICVTAATAFLLFRLFDIIKPWPVCTAERLPAGWGILADDLVAGLYGAAVFMVLWNMGWLAKVSSWIYVPSVLSIESAAMLGMIQGLTEFLPVSSSGHLVLFESFLPDLNEEGPEMLLFDLAIHVGTLLAIFVVYLKSIKKFAADIISFPKYGMNPVTLYKKSPSIHFIVCGGVTTVVTVVIYAIFKDQLESARKLPLIAAMWVVTGTFLLITDMRRKARLGLREFGLLCAVVVGAAQAFAILPGISRSGATICAAILLGLHRRWAIEYSFFIAIPAILGGAILKFIEGFSLVGTQISVPSLISGVLSSFIIGILALTILIKSSRKRRLKWFAFYCYILAGVVFFLYLR